MSDAPDYSRFNKPKPNDIPVNKMNTDQLKDKAEEILNGPEVQQAVVKGKTFFEANRPIIVTGAVVLLVMKVNKRMVKKATAKAFDKEIPGIIDTVSAELPSMFDVLRDLNKTPGMAYIPHGGGMVHLLGAKDAVITVFGNFEKMSNDEIFDHAARVLRFRR